MGPGPGKRNVDWNGGGMDEEKHHNWPTPHVVATATTPESELLLVIEGRCPLAPSPPMQPSSKPRCVSRGFCFGARQRPATCQGGTDGRAFRFKDEGRYIDYYKRHKEVTGIDADYCGNPFYYASLEVLAQSIEAVGSMDREAIATHFRDRKFKTFLGELSFVDVKEHRGDRKAHQKRLYQ